MTLDDLDLFPPPDGDRAPRTCRHPRPRRERYEGTWRCESCGHVANPDRIRGGRRNRNRGNAIERDIGRRLGLRRVGQFGGPEDLSGDLFAAQVKSGGAFPERLWSWLRAVPTNAGQTPLLVVTDAPGSGHRRRALVVLDLDSWAELHGIAEDAA